MYQAMAHKVLTAKSEAPDPTDEGFSSSYVYTHYENMPIQMYWKLYNLKRKIFRWIFWYFFIFLLKT